MIAVITGATAGIGKACAQQFASQGYNLVLTGRRAEKLHAFSEELTQEYGIEVIPLVFDVRSREATESALHSLPASWRAVDILINNAGLALGKDSIHEGDPADWDAMIDTNVKGLLYVSKVIMPWMTARKQGHIINIGSVAGTEVYPKGNIYCASKHAVEAISQGMRQDLLPYNIRVTNICPGLVETEFSVVRFKGDAAKAEAVYQGYQPLVAKDIADVIWYAASLPPHICLNNINLTCTAQANSTLLHRQSS